MSFERPAVPPAEPAPVPPPGGDESGGLKVPTAMRLQILSTEHWSLLASRSLAWNESFSRAGMFLTTLTGSIVALALVAQADEFGDGFRIFALVILPVVLLIGIGTNLRMGMSNYHEALCVVGMNRIRAGYVELAPDVERFMVMGVTDDDRGVAQTMAMPPNTSLFVELLASTPLLLTVLNSVLVGAILALLSIQLGTDIGPALAIGAVGFAASVGFWSWYATSQIAAARAKFTPAFPSPAKEATDPIE